MWHGIKISSIYSSGHAAPGAPDDSVVSTVEHFLHAFPQQIVVAYECAFGKTSVYELPAKACRERLPFCQAERSRRRSPKAMRRCTPAELCVRCKAMTGSVGVLSIRICSSGTARSIGCDRRRWPWSCSARSPKSFSGTCSPWSLMPCCHLPLTLKPLVHL